MIDKNLEWFRTLLAYTLPPADSENPTSIASQFATKSINPKQTLGTVLVLCGYKLYFCMYHPTMQGTRSRNVSEDSDVSEDEIKVEKYDTIKKICFFSCQRVTESVLITFSMVFRIFWTD
jgi:hypothetical protein